MHREAKENIVQDAGPAAQKNRLPERTMSTSSRFKLPPNYEINQVIGTGAYGSVCEAKDHTTGELVAVKRVGHLFKDLIDCKRILREVAILAKLSHPSIVQLHDITAPGNGASFQELYIIMEICDSDMKKLIRADVSLSPLHINTLLYNLLVGLKFLHSAGIYHRDLKPANCLVNQDCSVKICDFGLSRAVGGEDFNCPTLPDSPRLSNPNSNDGTAKSSFTATAKCTPLTKRHLTGHVVTRWYRAPELILLQDNYTEAIDVWSAGCIYAELLGMLKGTEFKDRSPLFPGASCFPLSPDRDHKHDYRYHTRGKHDQLNMIFNLLGTPSDEELVSFHFNADARRYIHCFAKRPGQGIRCRFLHATRDSCDMLASMLQFGPDKRVKVADALDHRLFYEDTLSGTPMIRNKQQETTAARPVSLAFEQEADLDEESLRHYFCQEISALRQSKGLPHCKEFSPLRSPHLSPQSL